MMLYRLVAWWNHRHIRAGLRHRAQWAQAGFPNGCTDAWTRRGCGHCPKPSDRAIRAHRPAPPPR